MDNCELWLAHEQPVRQLAFGAWICDCDVCLDVLAASEAARPGLQLVLKTAMDRIVVSAVDVLEARMAEKAFETFLHDPEDWIREVFVADTPQREKRLSRWQHLKLVK